MTVQQALDFLKHRLSLGVEGNVYFTEREALRVAISVMEEKLKTQ